MPFAITILRDKDLILASTSTFCLLSKLRTVNSSTEAIAGEAAIDLQDPKSPETFPPPRGRARLKQGEKL
jgi:hypothetical protein